MKTTTGFALVVTALVAAASMAAAAEHVPARYEPDAQVLPAQHITRVGKMDVDVWVNKDEGGVYRPGESMNVYFRSAADAYVLVFNVDTDGYIHLIYPYGPDDPPFVDGGRDYRIPSRSDPYDLVADGPPGIEYVVAVASPFPFQDLPWYLSADRADGDRPDVRSDEDDTESGQIEGDPYVGIDRIIRRIAPQGSEDRIATNETYFYIDRRVDYPRYVCADCHYHPFYFDPYVNACSVFEIRVDATWAHYAPIRYGAVRPRYIYRVRSGAPSRYRQWKQQWSSLDGRATLRSRFLPDRDVRYRRERAPQSRQARPEVRDLRRYREGRIWRGRDEILKLRENRDRVKEQDRARTGPPSDRGSANRGRGWWWQRGERRGQQDQGQDRGRAPQGGDRGRQQQPPERWKDRGDRGGDRPSPPPQERRERQDRGNRDDRGHKDDRRDQGNQDKGDKGDKGYRGDRGDRGDRRDRGR